MSDSENTKVTVADVAKAVKLDEKYVAAAELNDTELKDAFLVATEKNETMRKARLQGNIGFFMTLGGAMVSSGFDNNMSVFVPAVAVGLIGFGLVMRSFFMSNPNGKQPDPRADIMKKAEGNIFRAYDAQKMPTPKV